MVYRTDVQNGSSTYCEHNNDNQSPKKLIARYFQVVSKLKGIEKIIEQARSFLRRNGRAVLLSASIAATSLFQPGCTAVETGFVFLFGDKESWEQGWIFKDESNPWKRLDLRDKVNLALDSNTPNSTLKAMGQDVKLVNYLLNEVQNYNNKKEDDWRQAIGALKRMQFPSQTYNKLYLDKNMNVRQVVAGNNYSPPDILNVLAKDKEKIIRVNVAWNLGATPDSTLKAMGQDAEVVNWFVNNVRTYDEEKEDEWRHSMKVLERMQLSLRTYKKLCLDKNGNVRSVVACNHYSPPSLLEDLAKDKDKIVRMNVASNPVTPIEVLESLHKDPKDEVVEKVHSNSTWQKYIVGTPHDKYLNVVWAENGRFRPADGYDWVSNPPSAQNFRVKFMPNIEKDIFGNIYPADGYCWMSDDPWGKHDFHVKYIPFGAPHNKHPNVVWAGNGMLHPAPGYDWVNKDDPEDFRVKRSWQLDPMTEAYWRSQHQYLRGKDIERQYREHKARMDIMYAPINSRH